jgi:hypothetical protein
MIYTAKCYWPGVTERQLEQAAARAVLAATTSARTGSAIAYLGSILLEENELMLCLFDAASRAAVLTTTERAGIPCERVIDSRWLPAPAETHQQHPPIRSPARSRAASTCQPEE